MVRVVCQLSPIHWLFRTVLYKKKKIIFVLNVNRGIKNKKMDANLVKILLFKKGVSFVMIMIVVVLCVHLGGI